MFVKMGFPASGHLSMKYWLAVRIEARICFLWGNFCPLASVMRNRQSREVVNILMLMFVMMRDM
jgi:hypothetical protein